MANLEELMNQLSIDNTCISCQGRECWQDSKYCWVCSKHFPTCRFCGKASTSYSPKCEACWDEMTRMETHECCWCKTECNANSQCCGRCARQF